MLSDEPQWVALYTNPRAEKRAELNLQKAGYETYLPMRHELHTWSDRKKWVDVPLLKSYVFARITKRQVVLIRSVDSVSRIISFKGVVATIPDFEIQMMKDFLASELEVRVRATEQLRQGARVRINSGTFAGREGMLVSDCDDGNFAVEISGISMSMLVHIDMDLLEVIPDNEVKKKKKYTIR